MVLPRYCEDGPDRNARLLSKGLLAFIVTTVVVAPGAFSS
jgi:hypothetical protein